MSIQVGFTGTRKGMTKAQKQEVKRLLSILEVKSLHLGDCVGADADCHAIADQMRARPIIVCHPPVKDDERAFCTYDVTLGRRPYLERNKTIVDSCDLLIATPKDSRPELRSGTWATIRYAKKKGTSVCIVYPDGKSVRDNVVIC